MFKKRHGSYNIHLNESYYAHNCIVIPDKDILEIGILGSTFLPKFKRWWYDLFLLSYSHNMAKEVYFSSHAMRMARIRQFRNYRGRIHPMSKFRIFWDSLMIIIIIYLKLSFRLTSSIIFDNVSIFVYYLNLFLEMFLIIDLYVAMKTGYYNEEAKEVILDTKESLIHFCSTKLFIYMASAVPLNGLLFIRYGNNIVCGLCKANIFVFILRGISTFSLYRIFELSESWTKRGAAKNINWHKFLRISILGFLTMHHLYDLSDVIKLIKFISIGHLDENTFIGRVIFLKYSGLYDETITNINFFLYNLIRLLKSLLLFNFNLTSVHYVDKFAELVIYVVANIFYIWFVLESFRVLSQIRYSKDQHFRFKQCTMNLLSARQLPDDLRAKVEQHFAFKPCILNLTETDNRLYKSLPSMLKREIVVKCYMKYLQRVTYFKEWPLEILEDLAMMLKREMFLPEDMVAEAWEQGAGLLIVDVGVLAVYSTRRQEIGHLIDGDYFGEVSLVTEKEIGISYVVAVTPCMIFLLQKLQFRQYMRNHPKLFYQLKTELKEKYKVSVTKY